jgi:hypothetical protein
VIAAEPFVNEEGKYKDKETVPQLEETLSINDEVKETVQRPDKTIRSS